MKNMFQKQSMKKSVILLLIAALIILVLPQQKILAEDNYTYSDSKTSVTLNGGGYYFSGEHMVYHVSDKNGDRQIYYKNLITNEVKQITNIASAKQSLAVSVTSQGHIVVVWSDKRGHDQYGRIWDVYSYDLNTNVEKKLNSEEGQFTDPSLDGDYVVWEGPTEGRKMYLYDLVQNKEIYIGIGNVPVVVDGKVLYMSIDYDKFYIYQIQSKEVENLLELPAGKYVIEFEFNGDDILFKQTDHHSNIQYRMIDTEADALTPINLTEEFKPEKNFRGMEIGENYAVWIQDIDGYPQVIGVNMETAQTFQMTNDTSAKDLISFQGDQLILKGEDGKLVYRSIIQENKTQDQTASNPSPVVQVPPLNKIGPNGGVVQIESGKVKVEFLKNTFKEDATIELLANENIVKSSNLGKGMQFINKAWEIKSDKPFLQKAKLTISYDKNQLIPQKVQKLGIYQYDPKSATWKYIYNKLNTTSGTLEADIREPGIYSVLLNEKTYSDIQGHWAKQTIEVLASRSLVNGTKENQFSPNMLLTRAQFAKMLVSAMGVEPTHSKSPSYADVPTTHWAYDWIEAAALAGWIQGDKRNFHPNDVLTREQMAIMLMRAIGVDTSALSQSEIERNLNFKDTKKISSWAKPYVSLAVQQGLIQGANGEVLPNQSSTRAQAAVVIYRLLTQLKII